MIKNDFSVVKLQSGEVIKKDEGNSKEVEDYSFTDADADAENDFAVARAQSDEVFAEDRDADDEMFDETEDDKGFEKSNSSASPKNNSYNNDPIDEEDEFDSGEEKSESDLSYYNLDIDYRFGYKSGDGDDSNESDTGSMWSLLSDIEKM